MALPPCVEARVVEFDLGVRAALHELKLHERIHAGRPISRAPRLNNALVGYYLYVSPDYQSAEHRKGTAGFAVNLRRCSGEGSELVGVEKRLVDALRAYIEFNHLVQGCAPAVRIRIRHCRRRLLRHVLGARGLHTQSPDREGSAQDKLPPRPYIERPRRFFSQVHHGLAASSIREAILLYRESAFMEARPQNMFKIIFGLACDD